MPIITREKKCATMDLYDKIYDLGRRRGLMFPSFEIYGGLGGFYDYGPVGAPLKRNIENKWIEMFVLREGMVEIESTVIMPEPVFTASGHIAHFTDILTKCTKCGQNYETNKVIEEAGIEVQENLTAEEFDRVVNEKNVRCPKCGGELGESAPFNLMFKVDIGPYGGSITGYGRPEAAQAQFVDFKRVYSVERERLPLGVAQIGRCLRNEIAPRKGPIRLREFTIIDYEVFFDPEDPSYAKIKLLEDQKIHVLTANQQIAGTNRIEEATVKEALEKGLISNQIQAYFLALAVRYLEDLGIPVEKQRLRELLPDEKAHYSKQTFDQEVWLERWGWTEVSGSAYRTDYDLSRHMLYSGVDMRVFKSFDKSKWIKKIVQKPRRDLIEADFGEDSMRILDLLSKSDPNVIKRELETKGYYELPGPTPSKLESKHVEFETVEEEASGRYFTPHVVEPSFGVDRIFYSVLEYAYTEKKGRVILRIPRDVAPIKALVLPLVDKDGIPELAEKAYNIIIDDGIEAKYDDAGSIGKRYARADEVGIPICVTIDYESLKDETVTLRDRDSWSQVRAKICDVPALLRDFIRGKKKFNELGPPLNSAPSKQTSD